MALLLKDCLQVASESPHENVGVLIYASHRRYGGGYRNHSKAQEEWCFNRTTLPTLSPPHGYYPVKQNEVRGFVRYATLKPPYVNRGVFFIFVPAPVWSKAKSAERDKALMNRARLVFELADEEQLDHLVLGAWGCGVFGCPAAKVARYFGSLEQGRDYAVDYAFLHTKMLNTFAEERKKNGYPT